MARVEGFEPAQSGQQPVDVNGDPAAVGVWGDSSTGVGVFGTSGTLPPAVDDIPVNIAGVEGHSIQNPGVMGRSIEDAGVSGESLQGLGMLGRSSTGTGVLGVTFAPTVPGEPPSAAGVFGSSVAGGNGVTGFVGSATGVVGSSVRRIGVRGTSGDQDGVSGFSLAANGGRGIGGGRGREIASGVFGSSDSGFGVRGVSNSRDGTVGVTFGGGAGRAPRRSAATSRAARETRPREKRFRANEVRLLLGVIAYNLGNLLRRLVLPVAIQDWSVTSLQQRLLKTGRRLIRRARYFTSSLPKAT